MREATRKHSLISHLCVEKEIFSRRFPGNVSYGCSSVNSRAAASVPANLAARGAQPGLIMSVSKCAATRGWAPAQGSMRSTHLESHIHALASGRSWALLQSESSHTAGWCLGAVGHKGRLNWNARCPGTGFERGWLCMGPHLTAQDETSAGGWEELA